MTSRNDSKLLHILLEIEYLPVIVGNALLFKGEWV